VRDAAVLLGAMTGPDPANPARLQPGGNRPTEYTRYLNPDALQGKRLGVEKSHLTGSSEAVTVFKQALEVLKKQGATLVEIEVTKETDRLGQAEFDVLLYEFKDGLNKYLATANAGVKSLADVIAFNEKNAARMMPYFKQEILEMAEKTEGLGSAKFKAALKKSQAGARAVLDGLLGKHQLDAVVGITTGPAVCIDLVNGDYSNGLSFSSPAAMAGYPHLTVPMGQVHGLPVGLSIVSGPYTEPLLFGLGFAYEQAAGLRKAPTFQASLAPAPPGQAEPDKK
jgi:amidase